MNPKMFAVPGFLGLSSDWNHLELEALEGVDLFRFNCSDFSRWSEDFNAFATRQSDARVLMGYSMGARLALHALLRDPSQWKRAILISVHPGLKDEKERKKRILNDQAWASCFLNDPWENLMKRWNAQDVFKEDLFHLNRREQDYCRSNLESCLKGFSLGYQEDLRAEIMKLDLPILWVTGELDHRFTQVADEVDFRHPSSRKIVIPGASHRLLWSHAKELKSHIQEFLKCEI